MKKEEDKIMLQGWRIAMLIIGVLAILLGVAEIVLMQRWDIATDMIVGGIGLFLLSSVLSWMGEVENHLSSVNVNIATCADRLARIERQLDAAERARKGAEDRSATARQASSMPRHYDA